MTLGETIYTLRTAKNLSQGDLANLLDVSRQSVSKWETDAAVPDLDKLLKLADLFEVTLDELTGRTPPDPRPVQKIEVVTRHVAPSTQTVVGLVLLGGAILLGCVLVFLTRALSTLLFPLPLLVCGVLCLCTKKAWYWCLWTAAVTGQFIAALSAATVGVPPLSAVLLAQLATLLLMVPITFRAFRSEEGRPAACWKLLTGWVLWLAGEAGAFLLLVGGTGSEVILEGILSFLHFSWAFAGTVGGLVFYYLLHSALTVGLALLCAHTVLALRARSRS